MRKEFKKALIHTFADELRKCDNGFAVATIRSIYVGPGETIYEKIVNTTTRVFVILIPDSKREAFMLEIGWSKLGRFPELPMRPSGRPTPDRLEFERTEFVCRIEKLYDPTFSYWYIQPTINPFEDTAVDSAKSSAQPLTPDSVEKLVRPTVLAAIEKLVKFGFPYLNEYIIATSTSAPTVGNQ